MNVKDNACSVQGSSISEISRTILGRGSTISHHNDS